MIKLLIFFVVLATTVATKSCDKSTSDKSTTQEQTVLKQITIKDPPIVVASDTSMHIENAVAKDSVLSLTISYLGCETDDFELISDGMILKTLPPRLVVFLNHISQTKCKTKRHSKTVLFDIADYRHHQNELHLIIKGQTTIVLKNN
jgi:hypothetical protein